MVSGAGYGYFGGRSYGAEVRVLRCRVRQIPDQISPVVKDKGYFSQRVQGGEPCRGESLGGTGAQLRTKRFPPGNSSKPLSRVPRRRVEVGGRQNGRADSIVCIRAQTARIVWTVVKTRVTSKRSQVRILPRIFVDRVAQLAEQPLVACSPSTHLPTGGERSWLD